MRELFEKANDDLQRMSKDNYDTMLRSYGELNKSMQSIASSWTDYAKRSFDDATHAFEQLDWCQDAGASLRNPVSICQEGLRGLDGAGIKAHRDVRRHGAGRLQAS